MTVLNRVLGTTLAAGALLLTVGVLPAGAQTAVTGQATFTGFSLGGASFSADYGAYTRAYANAEAAGYTAAQCHVSRGPFALMINPTLWEATAQVTCNA
jgi:hypothetical protein